VARDLFPTPRRFTIYREIESDARGFTVEWMRDRRGVHERRFATEAQALAAIAKATGAQS
jgi:hypothetical protein